jgi:hypothetical protein
LTGLLTIVFIIGCHLLRHVIKHLLDVQVLLLELARVSDLLYKLSLDLSQVFVHFTRVHGLGTKPLEDLFPAICLCSYTSFLGEDLRDVDTKLSIGAGRGYLLFGHCLVELAKNVGVVKEEFGMR